MITADTPPNEHVQSSSGTRHFKSPTVLIKDSESKPNVNDNAPMSDMEEEEENNRPRSDTQLVNDEQDDYPDGEHEAKYTIEQIGSNEVCCPLCH